MGEQLKNAIISKSDRKEFIKNLIEDVGALEVLLKEKRFESEPIRIGAEQEFCLVDEDFRPANNAIEILDLIKDEHFTTELAKYSLEINLDPFVLEKRAFSKVESQLHALLKKGATTAEKLGTKILLAGILPSITKKEVYLDYLTPMARYMALNKALKKAKGSDFRLKIRGVDELSIHHDSILFEACNTSFQLHLQIEADDFVNSYNWSQAISGPVLAVCCNSPLLLGRELWAETRIALFQQSLDTRKHSYALRNQQPRVGFGSNWIKESVADIFKEDISNHAVLITKPIQESSLAAIANNKTPKLQALRLHNGTVYRWNRPCYGIMNDQPHLRIENRYLPSGPSVIDEIANFAFWIGLMKGRPEKYNDLHTKMDFRAVKANFVRAARNGKETVFQWQNETIDAKKMILDHFLPIAYDGLQKCKIDSEDIHKYLSIIEKRTLGKSGAEWQIQNFRTIKDSKKLGTTLKMLTEAMYENQTTQEPVHQWQMIKKQHKKTTFKPRLVRQIMSTQLFKLQENDYVSLAKAIMRWNNIHHIPIENEEGELSGLLTSSYLKELEKNRDINEALVSEIMIKKITIIEPSSEINKAIQLMEKNEIGCLPVCSNRVLVGIVSKNDL